MKKISKKAQNEILAKVLIHTPAMVFVLAAIAVYSNIFSGISMEVLILIGLICLLQAIVVGSYMRRRGTKPVKMPKKKKIARLLIHISATLMILAFTYFPVVNYVISFYDTGKPILSESQVLMIVSVGNAIGIVGLASIIPGVLAGLYLLRCNKK